MKNETPGAQCVTQPSGEQVLVKSLPRFVGGRSDNDNSRMSVLVFSKPLTAEHHAEIARRVAAVAVSCAAREAIARVIAPDWFAYPEAINNYPDQHLKFQEAALKKADAILALLAVGGEAPKHGH